ncbi:hypothetical protein QUF55_05655 [Clostridiaceae bacterium HSG29]|nr:hypothetical protein [Clostridiaceae bacterium HSG29]
MKKIAILFIVFSLFTISANFCMVEINHNTEAEKLKEIGVFKGTDNGFELDRAPNRLEGGVMFVRLLGAENEAIENNYSHPFADVPEWGSAYVGYLYHKGLTNGISDTEFGSVNIMDAKSYLTFMLRALDYDDSKGDFSWSVAVEKSNEIGLIDNDYMTNLKSNTFLRDHVAYISFNTLNQHINKSELSLASKLVDNGAFSEESAISMGVLNKKQNNISSLGSPLSKFTKDDLILLGADNFSGSDEEIASQILKWQSDNMIYASDSQNYTDVSYAMRWDYTFPGIYTTKDMINNMKDGNKIYGICFNYATIFADIANYYGLEVRVTNTTVKPSEISNNPFYKATATGLGPDEYSYFKKWLVKKGLNPDDYPYEAVRLIMSETALHYRAEIKINDEWVKYDTYRSENASADQYSFIETNWQEGNKKDELADYVIRLNNGENLNSGGDAYQTYSEFLEARIIRIEMDELESYKGITDDLGQTKRAATQDDLHQGYGLIPYFNNKSDILSFMSNLDWLAEEIDEYFEVKDLIESQSDAKYYIIAEVMLTPEDDNDILPYSVFLEQYLGYTGEDISNVLTEEIYNQQIK